MILAATASLLGLLMRVDYFGRLEVGACDECERTVCPLYVGAQFSCHEVCVGSSHEVTDCAADGFAVCTQESAVSSLSYSRGACGFVSSLHAFSSAAYIQVILGAVVLPFDTNGKHVAFSQAECPGDVCRDVNLPITMEAYVVFPTFNEILHVAVVLRI